MNTLGNTLRVSLIGILLAFLLTGCALVKWFFGEEGEKDPSELMTEGIENVDKGRYAAAAEAFQKLKDRYPYSQYAVQAELKMADSLYMTEEYDQAYEAYDEFEKLHPKHKDIPYVIYQKGMCHFKQMTTVDREQGYTRKAREEFERLIGRFPRDEYAAKARMNLRKCLVHLAEHELQVGHFYFQKGHYSAALARYTYLIENLPDMGQYHEALEYISRCRQQLAKEEKAARKEK